MIPDLVIQKVKETAICTEVISDFIELKKEGSSNMVARCPFHDEKSASFKVDVKENFFKCFGCGKAGDAIDFLVLYKKMTFQDSVRHLAAKYNIPVDDGMVKVYARPVQKNVTQLSDKALAWFKNKRGISQATIIKLGTTQSLTWMYASKDNKGADVPEGERNCIDFNYYRGKELVNVKYRDHLKNFRLYKDAELILYNLNSLEGATEAFIVEGEMDVHALVEAGIQKPGTAVLSVPNGANVKNNNLSYLDGDNMDLFKGVKTIYLAVDDDTAGRKLREDLSLRFGKGRCRIVEWMGKKDANDVLVAYGPEKVRECCEQYKEFPMEGVFSIADYDSAITDMYRNGIPPGYGIGLDKFDTLLRFEPGWITTVTGMPSSGKSDWVDQIALSLMLRHDWKFAFYSPENDPFPLHFSKLARKLIGKSWRNISELEVNLVKRFLQDRIWIIKPKKNFTLESILDSTNDLFERHGITGFVIDAWNRLEHRYSGDNVAKFTQESLMSLDTFCRNRNLHNFLVAHPKVMEINKKTGEYPVPRMYDISGGAHFRNITANGISVHRDYNKKVTEIYVQKVKFIPYWGQMGDVTMKYELDSGRFYEAPTPDSGIPDLSNWITKENRQAKVQVPEEEYRVSLLKDGDDLPF